MKNVSLTSLLLITVLVFTSCSVENDPILDEQVSLSSRDIFENPPKVQRNPDGSYYVSYELKEGVGSDVISNNDTNTKDINVYSSNSQTQRSFNEDLSLNGKDQFSVGINNIEADNKSTITIFDNDIKFSRNAKQDHLKEYEVKDNGDGTYTLNFTVKNNIIADFVYNEKDGVYEIKLAENSGAFKSNYNRTFTKEEGKSLEIAFINYFYNSTGRNSIASTTSMIEEKRPRVVVQ